MAESLIYPTVVSLPLGYDCTIIPPIDQIGKRLITDRANIKLYFCVVRQGEIVLEHSEVFCFSKGVLQGEMPVPFVWPDQAELGEAHPSYLEMGVVPEDMCFVLPTPTPDNLVWLPLQARCFVSADTDSEEPRDRKSKLLPRVAPAPCTAREQA